MLQKCRISNAPLIDLFSLGDLAVSDFVAEQPKQLNKAPLTLMYSSESKLLQLSHNVDLDKMYGKYWYRSGTNASMKKALKDIVDSALRVYKGPQDGVWLDIASNDGTLLSFVPKTFSCCGIDPADNSFVNESRQYGSIVQDFFSEEAYYETRPGSLCQKANIITCIAMFYDLDNPIEFLQNIYKVLDDNGLFIIQLSYTPLMVEQLAFDNICHEHLTYYTYYSINNLLKKVGFRIRDVEINDVNGGSFRLYIQKQASLTTAFGTAPQRDIGNLRCQMMQSYEELNEVNEIWYYMEFFKKITKLKSETYSCIRALKDQGKSIWAYGASTKGNTLLQWFGLDHSLIDGAAERSPYKYGLRTIATDIPIYSEEYMRSVKPDYLLILPWHFIDEFKTREANYLAQGGKFIVPCPDLQIICKDYE